MPARNNRRSVSRLSLSRGREEFNPPSPSTVTTTFSYNNQKNHNIIQPSLRSSFAGFSSTLEKSPKKRLSQKGKMKKKKSSSLVMGRPPVTPELLDKILVGKAAKNEKKSSPKSPRAPSQTIETYDPLAAADQRIQQLRSRLEEMKSKVQAVDGYRQQDKEDIALKLQEMKLRLKKKLTAKYLPEGSTNNKKCRQDELLLEQRNKMIEQLREENRGLRDQMEFIRRDIRELKVNNKRLERVNEKVYRSTDQLVKHSKQLDAVHSKLKRTVKAYKGQLAKAKNEYKKRDDHYDAEVQGREAFEKGLGKIVPVIVRRSDELEMSELSTEVIDTIKAATALANQQRDKELSKAGLTTTPLNPIPLRARRSGLIRGMLGQSSRRIDLTAFKDDSDSDFDYDSDSSEE